MIFHTGKTPASLVGFNGGALTSVLLQEITLRADTAAITENLACAPEPGCALLVGLGLICLAGLSWKFNGQVHI